MLTTIAFWFAVADMSVFVEEYQSNYVNDETKHWNQQQVLSCDLLRLKESFETLTKDVIGDKDEE